MRKEPHGISPSIKATCAICNSGGLVAVTPTKTDKCGLSLQNVLRKGYTVVMPESD